MAVALIGLGANLGDRLGALERAVERLRTTPGIAVVAVSQWRETAAIGGPIGQPPFLNRAVRLRTSLSPPELLAALHTIEQGAGRRRGVRWDARPLDLDLLLYDDVVLQSADLTVPHPRLAFRRFVLEPAAEIASEHRHPTLGRTVGELLRHLNEAANYVAVTGVFPLAQRTLAERLAARCGGRFLADSAPDSPSVVNSTGPGLAEAIESLDGRRRLLAAVGWVAGESTVSGFWLGEGLAAARAKLAPDELARYEPAWEAARTETAAPKLIVALGPFSEVPGDRRETRFRQELAELLRQPGQAPVLYLPAEDASCAEDEVAAAVLAMR